jgi:hypothetical protein
MPLPAPIALSPRPPDPALCRNWRTNPWCISPTVSEPRPRGSGTQIFATKHWQLSENAEVVAATALEIGRLETELADSKIASGTLGYLEDPPDAGDVVDAVARHVQSVLGRVDLTTLTEAQTGTRERTGRAPGNKPGESPAARNSRTLRIRGPRSPANVKSENPPPIRDIALDLIEYARKQATEDWRAAS